VTVCGARCEGTSEVEKTSTVHKKVFSWHVLENRCVRYCTECYRNVSSIATDLVVQTSPPLAWETPDPKKTKLIVDTVIRYVSLGQYRFVMKITLKA